MQEPTVSVIVTTYNRERYLKETIQSILNQTFSDFELIVVDNYSNYDFIKLIEEFNDPRIRPFQNINNGIIAVNRNYGISKAKGKFLAFCDDDDLWMPEKLERQVEFISKCKEHALVCANLARFSDNPNNSRAPKFKSQYISLRNLLFKNPVATSSVLINNDEKVRFDESTYLITVEDYEMWLRLFLEGVKIYFVGEPLVYYRENSQNTSKGQNYFLLPVRRIYLLSQLKIKYHLSGSKYIMHVFLNVVELAAKLVFKR